MIPDGCCFRAAQLYFSISWPFIIMITRLYFILGVLRGKAFVLVYMIDDICSSRCLASAPFTLFSDMPLH